MTDQHPITPPLSLKQQALEALDNIAFDLGVPSTYLVHEEINTIRRALEDLDD